jgi:predicted RNA-binding protein with PIN domain
MNDALPVLIVDAANVVGSRPDGWWRDRHGATERLRDALEPLADGHEVILVVEGQARRVSPADRVQVLAAPGSGDDEIVRAAADMTTRERRVIVATADRELRQRLTEIGAELIGPKTLPYAGR